MAVDSSHRKLILKETPATLKITVSEDDQTKDPDSATISIVNSAGDTVVAETAATLGAPGDGEVTYALAAQAELENLTATWTLQVDGVESVLEQTIEIVGEFYFNLLDLRSMSGLSDSGVFPLAQLEESRMQAQDLFERVTGVAWVPHFARETYDGKGGTRLQLRRLYPREVKDLTIDGTALTASQLADVELYDDGEIYYPGGFPKDVRNVEIGYTHGFDRPPEDLRIAAKKYARQLVLGTQGRIPSRAVQMSTEAGQFNLTVAGQKRPTGDPEIDAILWQHDKTIPAIG